MRKRRMKRAYYRAFRTHSIPHAAAQIRANTPAEAKRIIEASPGVLESWAIGAEQFKIETVKMSI